jgi:hypothetical protein
MSDYTPSSMEDFIRGLDQTGGSEFRVDDRDGRTIAVVQDALDFSVIGDTTVFYTLKTYARSASSWYNLSKSSINRFGVS